MGLYADYALPRLIHFAMKNKDAARLRGKYVPAAAGRVLEIGIGSGLNLPFYGAGVSSVHGVDPSPQLIAMARAAGDKAGFEVALARQSAETLPFGRAAFDTVLTTWTLCSIPDAGAALDETRRVLKPGGRMIFVEHGRAPEAGVRRWQDRLNPLWRRCAGGCNLNRPIDGLIERAGYAIESMETGYLVTGPRPLAYHYAGTATPR